MSKSRRLKRPYKIVISALVFDCNGRLSVLLLDGKRPMLHIALDVLVIHFAAHETLCVKYGVLWIRVERIFRAIPNSVDHILVTSLRIFRQQTGRLTSVRGDVKGGAAVRDVLGDTRGTCCSTEV